VDGLSETSHRTREVSQTCCGHHFTPTRGLYLGEDRRWGFLNPTVRALSNCKPTLPSPSVTDSHSTAPDIVSHQLRAMILLCITRLAHSVSTKFSGRSQAMIVDVTLTLCMARSSQVAWIIRLTVLNGGGVRFLPLHFDPFGIFGCR